MGGRIMDFTTDWPKTAGWYWFVNTDYPAPTIGFIQGSTLYDSGREYERERHCIPGRYGIRIGDLIVPPDCADCRVSE